MDYLQRTPFFRLLLPFIIGIILYQYLEIQHWSLFALLCLSIIMISLSLALRKPQQQYQFRWLFGCGIFVFMLTLAYFLSTSREKADVFTHLNQKGIYKVELTSAPAEKTKSYLCKVEVLEFYDTSWKPAHGHAILYFQKDKVTSNLLFGDLLMVQADFAPLQKVLNPDGFDYATYLRRQGIGATCYISSGSWKLIDRDMSFSIRREADKCRKYLLEVYRKFQIKGNEYAVLAALTLGYTDDLHPDLLASYSATGVMHILSVSGMHVGVVYVVIVFLLGFMDKTQRLKVFKALFIVVFLWAYAFLSGMSAAVIRSALMFSFLSVATCFGRKSKIDNTIFMSMLLMLLVNPNYLYDVGFQLSYAAVLSIIFFKPIVDKLYTPTNKLTRFTWTMISVSIAAQLGTTPFTLYYFQQFPNYFLLTNLIVIPLSSLIIYLAMGLLMISFIPYLSVCVGFVLKWLVWILNFVIVTVQDLPFSVSHISLDLKQSLVIYVAIACFSFYYFNKKYTPLLIGLISVLLVCITNLEMTYHTFNSKRMIVYAGQKNTHVNFIERDQNYVFTTDSLELKRIAKSFWQHQKLEKPIYMNKNTWFNDGFANYEGSKILILTQDILKRKTTNTPLNLDYLIIGNRLKPKIEQIMECVHPKKVIVDTSISKWYSENIKQYCKNHQISFYSIAENGAYYLTIKD